MIAVEPGGWDALFAALKAGRVWGIVNVTLKDGDASLINYQRTFKSVEDAVAALAREPATDQ